MLDEAETQETLISVRFVDSLNGWAVGDNGAIQYTRNGGLTWHGQESGVDFDLHDVEPFSMYDVFVGGGLYFEGAVLSSVNGGAIWRKENIPEDFGYSTITRVGDYVLAAGRDASAATESTVFRRTVESGVNPIIVYTDLPGATLSLPYKASFRVVGGTPPYEWSLLLPPAGLELDPNTAELTGVPSTPGENYLVVQVEDSLQNSDYRMFTLTVSEEPLALSPIDLPAATHRIGYQVPLEVSGGHQPYHWSVIDGMMPSGMSVDRNAMLAGTPLETGSFDFTLQVVDSGSLPQQATMELHLEVTPLLEETWEVQHANNRVTDIHFFDENQGIAIGWSGVLLETKDGGRQWTRRYFGTYMLDFTWLGNEGWMIADHIYHSTDRGVNWNLLASRPIDWPMKILFRTPLKGWICGGDGIVYTEDGGKTWNSATAPSGESYESIGFFTDLRGFAGGYGQDLYRNK